MTESLTPEKKSKLELEQLVKAHGGKIYQTDTAAPNTICIADRSKLTQQTLILALTCQRNRKSGIAAKRGSREYRPTVMAL
jgi:hypothetical protein